MSESDGGRELAGSAAIVTGSIKNMGRMTAIALGEAGASVLINGRTSTAAAESVAQEVVRAGGRAVVHMADVTDSGQVAGMIARAADTFGRLDILVNNVSNRIAKPVAEITLDEWRGVIASTARFFAPRPRCPISRSRTGPRSSISAASRVMPASPTGRRWRRPRRGWSG